MCFEMAPCWSGMGAGKVKVGSVGGVKVGFVCR